MALCVCIISGGACRSRKYYCSVQVVGESDACVNAARTLHVFITAVVLISLDLRWLVLETMFHARNAFAMLCSGYVCVALPTLDLSRETLMDANKPPFPTVNIIADHPIRESAQAYQLRSAQGAQRSLLEKNTDAQQRFETASTVDIEAQNRQLENLRRINARISVSARDTKQAPH